MFFCMMTTLNLDDAVMRAVKRSAVESRRTMTEVIEECLRDTLMRTGEGVDEERFVLRLPTVKGRARPGVDLNDRESLLEIMEGRR